MPNHVKNVLRFRNLKQKDIEFILDTITDKLKDDSGYGIDSNKIIPEPEIESGCPDDCKVNKDSHIMEYEDRPWFDWYKWHNTYWGTKWNAYDCYSVIGKSYLELIFSTAWSMPYPVIQKLQLLGYKFELKYADEDYGANCGRLTYSREQGFDHYDESELENPHRFAESLWNMY